jgi:hypothetical protein
MDTNTLTVIAVAQGRKHHIFPDVVHILGDLQGLGAVRIGKNLIAFGAFPVLPDTLLGTGGFRMVMDHIRFLMLADLLIETKGIDLGGRDFKAQRLRVEHHILPLAVLVAGIGVQITHTILVIEIVHTKAGRACIVGIISEGRVINIDFSA